jgi:hypothetical protein
MRVLILSLLLLSPAPPAWTAECGSIVPSVCEMSLEEAAPARKVLRVMPTVTPYVVGDRFPVEERSFLMDPQALRSETLGRHLALLCAGGRGLPGRERLGPRAGSDPLTPHLAPALKAAQPKAGRGTSAMWTGFFPVA